MFALNILRIPSVSNDISVPQATSTTIGKATRQSVQSSPNYKPVVGQGILTRSSTSSGGSTYLVMDPCLGFVVGQVPSQSVSTDQMSSSSKSGVCNYY